MTFYLQPPSGNAPYEKLEDYALNRLRFLLRLSACKDKEERKETVLDAEMVNWSECLMAGNVKDKISHYIIRLNLARNADTSRFFCNAETTLFRMRLDSFSIQEWGLFFKSLGKNMSLDHKGQLANLHFVFEALRKESESWLSLAEGIKTKDRALCIHLPFQLLLRLVSKRRVILKQGYAAIPYHLIPDVLEEQFHSIMTSMLYQASQETSKIKTDVRMMRLSAILMRAYEGEVNPVLNIPLRSKAITLDTIFSSRAYFPPCMSQLIRQVHEQHRLCHHDRIQLTLFLKELGFPIHEALLFWKREYTKPVDCKSHVGCQHNWQGNERRYIYNIRHLYGLEGKRVSYSAHNCASIQGRQLTCNDHGGCPFTSLEPSALNDHLTKQGLVHSDIEDILDSVNRKCVERACSLYIRHSVKVASETGCVVYHTNSTQCVKTDRNVICHHCLECQRSRPIESFPPVSDCGVDRMASVERRKHDLEDKYTSGSEMEYAFSNEKFHKLGCTRRELKADYLRLRKGSSSTLITTLKTKGEDFQSKNITCDDQPENRDCGGKFEDDVAKLLPNDSHSSRVDLRNGHEEYQNHNKRQRKLFCCKPDTDKTCLDDEVTANINLDYPGMTCHCCGTEIDCKVNQDNHFPSTSSLQEFDLFRKMNNSKFLCKPVHLKKPSMFYWDFKASADS